MKFQVNVIALLVAGALAGCAQGGYGGSGAAGNVNGPPAHMQEGTGAQQGSSGTMGAQGSGATAGARGAQSMCALYSKLAQARSAEERQILLDQAMPGATPEMQQQHLAMMQQQCQ